jgi:1-acyl-sn-glycerol-3-phosphate acyltransferase
MAVHVSTGSESTLADVLTTNSVDLDEGDGPSPFKSLTPVGWREGSKIVLFTVTLVAPLRLILIVLLAMLWTLACGRWVHWGLTHMQLDTRMARCARSARTVLLRGVLFLAGFYWIDCPPPPPNPPRIIVSNHTSMWDALVLMYQLPCTVLAKEELFKIWGLGTVLRALGAIPVARASGRGKTGEMIAQRVNDLRLI